MREKIDTIDMLLSQQLGWGGLGGRGGGTSSGQYETAYVHDTRPRESLKNPRTCGWGGGGRYDIYEVGARGASEGGPGSRTALFLAFLPSFTILRGGGACVHCWRTGSTAASTH